MPFEPIAIVGQSCVLPGALTPGELWDQVVAGNDLLSDAPDGYWRTDHRLVESPHQKDAKDICWTRRGGYVRGFGSVFEPMGFAIPPEEILQYGTNVHWLLHTARQALAEAGREIGRGQKAGIIFGNLSYPSHAMSEYAEAVWLDRQEKDFCDGKARELAGVNRPHPLNRFMSGLPAHIVAQALELDAGAFAIDASCASSLFAIKLACDKLHDRTADLMLAGGINASDDLILHIGFCTLQAMSRTGQSRPFHQDADGLIPAQGAGFLALKRLDDAVAAGDDIYGVIRGVGLSNDGRGKGLLAPSPKGQFLAMQKAYAMSGIDPSEINLLECHATGTSVGDAIEIESTSRIFKGLREIPIGTIKSNMGHPITASGIAGIIKVTRAMRAGVRPPSLNVEALTDALGETPFRVLKEVEPWPATPKRMAGISNFGFGGNNAHLILEQWEKKGHVQAPYTRPDLKGEIAVVAMGAMAASGQGIDHFAKTVLSGQSALGRQDDGSLSAKLLSIDLPVLELKFFPTALEQTLPQQLAILKATLEAVAAVKKLPRERTGVFVGMGCDGEVTRSGMCWRLAQFVRDWLNIPEITPEAGQWIERVKDERINPARQASAILGAMPNVVANRINSQFDFGGQSFTVSSEELSGVRSLEIAMRALRAGEIDAAIVGAVDLSCETVHLSAVKETLDDHRQTPGDAAISLVLKRVEDARRDGDKIYALIDNDLGRQPIFKLGLTEQNPGLTHLIGHAHAASGLLHVAAAVLACHHRVLPPEDGGKALPFAAPEPLTAQVTIDALGKQSATIAVKEDTASPPEGLVLDTLPRIHIYSGKDRREVLDHLKAGIESDTGPARLVIVAKNAARLDERKDQAASLLEANASKSLSLGQGIYYCETPVQGETAFVFPGPASDYATMGQDLYLAFPQLLKETMAHMLLSQESVKQWMMDSPGEGDVPAWKTMCRSSFFAIFQAIISQEVFKLRPSAAIGYSSGESSSLFAMGAWRDMGPMFDDFLAHSVYTKEIAGEFNVARRSWGIDEPVQWTNWGLLAPKSEVEKAIQGEPKAHIIIVNTPDDIVIGGSSDACERVIEKVGRKNAYFLNNNVVNHCPEIKTYKKEWRKLHRRPTKKVPGVRFYTGATSAYYHPTADKAAASILGMATRTLDFPQMVENAYKDGVRIFIEHGPMGRCTRWIRQILKGKEHVAVAMDAKGRSCVDQMIHAMAQLKAGGVAIDTSLFQNAPFQMGENETAASNPRHIRSYAAHAPDITLPSLEIQPPQKANVIHLFEHAQFAPRSLPGGADEPDTTERQIMKPAPWLPLMIGEERTRSVDTFEEPTVKEASGMGGGNKMSGLVRQTVYQHHRIAKIHETFIQKMAEVQSRYLKNCENALFALDRMARYSSPAAGEPAAVSRTPYHPQTTIKMPSPPAGPPPATTPIQREPEKQEIDKSLSSPTKAHASKVMPLMPANAACDPMKAQFENPIYIEPRGPRFSKEQLEILASGKISEVFGEMFAIQDDYSRQVRLPEYPLLLADRITGLEAQPGAMGKGIIWTETDVVDNAWYLNDIYMPPGITVESGQCDLTLISYLGADFQNKGERVYRLLGCDLMYYGEPPRIGDTLCYQIHVDGHANLGATRIFFFRYDCRINGELRLSVRNARAGFFSDEELANSGGVLWNPQTGDHKPDSQANVAPPAVACTRRAFSIDQVEAFSLGKVYECFGPGFELACTHSKTPKIQSGKMRLIDKVTDFDSKGGPWGRGYLRVENKIPNDAWYLTCHFKDDPCMPGTLMSDACIQALAFYMAAMGFTLKRDGWRFDPVPNEVIQCKCRGQVVPDSEELIYEVFVEEMEVVDGLYPTIYADILATCDGLKILHMRRMGLRLVPDWPLDCWPHLIAGHSEKRPVAKIEEMQFDYRSLLACAFGKPSEAFGALGRPFDGGRHISRLPGPPYHFMSRVSMIDADMGAMKSGQTIEVEYDVPPSEWYFENNFNVMPFCVLMEVALQPCGWLAVFEGGPNTSEEPLYFRNLDGTGTVFKAIVPESGIVKTRTTLTNIARLSGVTLVNFDVALFVEDERIYEMKTGFGFFPKEALDNQVGLEAGKDQIAWLDEPNDFFMELTDRPDTYFGGELCLPGPMLLMIDRITGFWTEWGEKSLGRLRAEKTVDIDEWFFKAHFFHDPVQPGSLGVEAIIQTLMFYMIHENMHAGIKNPRFEAVAQDMPVTWKYRGQVTPNKKRITVELNILDKGPCEDGVWALAEGWLWADNLRIFNVKNLRINIRQGAPVSHDAGIKNKVAALTGVNPGQVHLLEDKNAAICKNLPFTVFPIEHGNPGNGQDDATIKAPCLDFDRMLAYGRRNIGVDKPWVGENILLGLCRQFTKHLILEDADAFEKVKGQSLLFLGNHQVQVESLLFPMMIQVLTERRVVTIASSIHRKGWVGRLYDCWYEYPGVDFPKNIVYFDQNDRESMFDILNYFKSKIKEEGICVFLHVEGCLGLSCRLPVTKMSSVFTDLSVEAKIPIVPVKFSGGLPTVEMKATNDFPFGYSKQEYHVGRPIPYEKLDAMPYAQRRQYVIDAINQLGPSHETEVPNAPDPAFEKNVKKWMKTKNVSEVQAVIFKALENIPGELDDASVRLIEKGKKSKIRFSNDAKGKWLKKMAGYLFDAEF